MIFVNDVDDKDFLTGLFNAMYDELPRRNQKRKNYMGEIKMSSKKRVHFSKPLIVSKDGIQQRDQIILQNCLYLRILLVLAVAVFQ